MEYLVLLLIALAVGSFLFLLNRWVNKWLKNRQEIELKKHDLRQGIRAVEQEERQATLRINEAVEAEQVAMLKAQLRFQAAEMIAKEKLVDELMDDRVKAERSVIEADAAARVELALEFAQRQCEAEVIRAAMPGTKRLKKLNKLYESYLVAVDEHESQVLAPLSFDQYVRAVTSVPSRAS